MLELLEGSREIIKRTKSCFQRGVINKVWLAEIFEIFETLFEIRFAFLCLKKEFWEKIIEIQNSITKIENWMKYYLETSVFNQKRHEWNLAARINFWTVVFEIFSRVGYFLK